MPLRVMTFNVLFGGGDEGRFARVLQVIRDTRPDVLILQECLGWEDGVRLRRVAEVMGLAAAQAGAAAHAYLGTARPRGSGKRYHVAAVSRVPMAGVTHYNDPAHLGHCIVQFDVPLGGEAVTVLGAHFDSHGEDPRLREARFVRSLIPRDRLRAGLYLLAGDLNALSPRDPYPPDLPELLRRAGTTKYGDPPRFDVMTELEAAGWVDVLHRPQSGAGSQATSRTPPDWVTASRDRGGVRIDYRTDYILASPAMAARVTRVVIPDAGDASDHAPVVAEFAHDVKATPRR